MIPQAFAEAIMEVDAIYSKRNIKMEVALHFDSDLSSLQRPPYFI